MIPIKDNFSFSFLNLFLWKTIFLIYGKINLWNRVTEKMEWIEKIIRNASFVMLAKIMELTHFQVVLLIFVYLN